MQVNEKGWRVVSGIHPPNMWQQMSPRLHQDASFNPVQPHYSNQIPSSSRKYTESDDVEEEIN